LQASAGTREGFSFLTEVKVLRHTVAILVENHPGVLTRVAGLFARRGYNIESLAVGITQDPKISRITIVVQGNGHTLEQVTKQLNKLVNVIKVSDITEDPHIGRELCLVKVHAEPCMRASILQVVDIFRAKIVDVSKKSVVVEITGDEQKVEALLDLLREFGIKEVVRTGTIAIVRGPKIVRTEKGEEEDGKDVLRWRCQPEPAGGKDRGGPGLRKPRTRPGSESER
jgi:acetolactate synthase-1/3 small subunit